MPQRYVINIPTLVVAIQGTAKMPITIPSASVVDVPQKVEELQGLIEVEFNGENVLMFAEDIKQRGKPVSKVQK
ncbi:hypothetical protein [Paludibaculum fermentans]|uniref:hypothetical protein n=1 Tax=Paludibaculum fermentans TaxID=1473598 RepID=UPI003EBB2863